MPTQDEINYGQRRINFELCEVDSKLIEAVRKLIEILQDTRQLPPPAASGARQTVFAPVEELLTEATTESKGVADIDPPGCLGY